LKTPLLKEHVIQNSYNHNYDAGDLKLVDRFENVQEYKSIQIFEGEDMKDVTDQFEIGVSAARPGASDSEPLEVRAIPKNQDDWDDTGKTLYMIIKGVKLVGTPDRMIDYLEDNPETPFTEGVTIPNQSYLHEGHAVASWVRKTDSNKTYVNFVAKPKMGKWVAAVAAAVLWAGAAFAGTFAGLRHLTSIMS